MEYEENLLEEAHLLDETHFGNKLLVKRKPSSGFKCTKCNREFTLSSNLTRHMRHNKICGFSKGFECANCHKVFSLNATMKDHYERCIAEDPYRFPCPNCAKNFTFKSSLNKHLRGRCRILKKKIQNQDVQTYPCKHCEAEFYDAEICEKHEKSGYCTSESISQPYVCAHCARTFTMKSSLTKHSKGRCKLMAGFVKSEEELNDQNFSSSNDGVEVYEVYENWFEPHDVIEECKDEIVDDHVESYVEISSETMSDEDKKYIFETENEGSNDLQETFQIEIDKLE